MNTEDKDEIYQQVQNIVDTHFNGIQKWESTLQKNLYELLIPMLSKMTPSKRWQVFCICLNGVVVGVSIAVSLKFL